MFNSEYEKEAYYTILDSNLFDDEYYRNTYEDIKREGEDFDVILHYVLFGATEDRNPNQWFNTSFYKSENRDVTDAGYNPFHHYISHGKSENRAYGSTTDILSQQNLEVSVENSIVIDEEFYLEKYPDVAHAGMSAEEHYWSFGEKEGRKPNKYFDPIFYKKINADVRISNTSLFGHYIDYGFEEGRATLPSFNNLERSNREKPLLFVGHDGIQAGAQVVLLEIIKWFCNHTNRRIKTILLSPGPVADAYSLYSDIYVLSNSNIDDPIEFGKFVEEEFEFVYMNTVVAGRLLEKISGYEEIEIKGDVITHIHEMEKVLEEHCNEIKFLRDRTVSWISASPSSSETLKSKYNILDSTLTTIPAFINPVRGYDSSIDTESIVIKESLGLSDEDFVVMGCGTVCERKGPDLFLDTARRLKAKGIENVKFIWIGDGPDKSHYESTLTESEKEVISFIGNKNNANEILLAADIFFMSSREDPFPLVVLEAAQHGVPSICFAPTTGITHFIQKDAGICLETVDTDLAAESIASLKNNTQALQEYGDNAKDKVYTHYTVDKQLLSIFKVICDNTNYKPSVSIIVPFYNHEKFVDKRINSIINQTIKDYEVILLDDCSTDNTKKCIAKYLDDFRFKIIANETNSGTPFKQWQKGIDNAKSEIIWVAEGDDFCNEIFLSCLLPSFDDSLVTIASAKTEIVDEYSKLQENALLGYLSSAYPGKFQKSYTNDGFIEVNQQLGAMCTLVNASGLLIKKSAIKHSLTEAQAYKMCGDWLIYLEVLKNGKICYNIDAVNYFRRHSQSQVHKIEGSKEYFKERFWITQYVIENYIISKTILKRAFRSIDSEWARFKYKHNCDLAALYDKNYLLKNARFKDKKPNVAFYVHGMNFSKGGIERVASGLANYLSRNGWGVTIYCNIGNNKPVYPLYESVQLIPVFNSADSKASQLQLTKSLLDKEISVFIPMLSESLFEPIIDAALDAGCRIIASEHNDPWVIQERWWNNEKRNEYFGKVDKIHLLLDSYRKSIPAKIIDNVEVIHNGIEVLGDAQEGNRNKVIMSVGRLAEQKRYDLLLDIAYDNRKLLRDQNFIIEIYGDGPLKEELLSKMYELAIQDIVHFRGTVSNIEEVYKKAYLYIVTSDFEGLPMTVLEALSHGLPCIGYSYCNGVNEIIEDKQNGYLVNTTAELNRTLVKLILEGIDDQVRMSARESANKYSISSSLSKWQTLISEVNDEK